MKTLTLLVAVTLPLLAQDRQSQADSVKAAAIVARHVAAVGGDAALRAITEYHIVMTTTMPKMSNVPIAAEMRQEVYVRKPNRMYMKLDMPGIGVTEMGFDGKTAWSNSALTGPTIHDEVPKQLADMADLTTPPLSGTRVSYVGRRQIGARTFDAVRAVFADGQVATHYFDVETGLMAGLDSEGTPPPPSGRMTMSFEDYKRFGGILQSTKMTILVQGQEVVMRTLLVGQGRIDDKIFELPAAVRQLLDKQRAGGKP